MKMSEKALEERRVTPETSLNMWRGGINSLNKYGIHYGNQQKGINYIKLEANV